MKIFCVASFKTEIERLKKNNSYLGIESDVIHEFFDKEILLLKKGVRLNGEEETPYIKGRINGSSGYRVYYLLIMKDDAAYLLYIHPKKGAFGVDNLLDKFVKELLIDVGSCIETNQNLFIVKCSENKRSYYLKLFQKKTKKTMKNLPR